MATEEKKSGGAIKKLKKNWGFIVLTLCLVLCLVVVGSIFSQIRKKKSLNGEIGDKEEQSILLDERNEELLDELESENLTDTIEQQARKDGYKSAGDILV